MEDEVLTLKQWRNIREMNQEKLSDKSGVSLRSIVKYENGKDNLRNAKYSTIVKLCKALDISVKNLFLESTSEKSETREKK